MTRGQSISRRVRLPSPKPAASDARTNSSKRIVTRGASLRGRDSLVRGRARSRRGGGVVALGRGAPAKPSDDGAPVVVLVRVEGAAGAGVVTRAEPVVNVTRMSREVALVLPRESFVPRSFGAPRRVCEELRRHASPFEAEHHQADDPDEEEEQGGQPENRRMQEGRADERREAGDAGDVRCAHPCLQRSVVLGRREIPRLVGHPELPARPRGLEAGQRGPVTGRLPERVHADPMIGRRGPAAGYEKVAAHAGHTDSSGGHRIRSFNVEKMLL